MIFLLMATCREQARWTECNHDALTVRHCCYWAYLEGYEIEPGVQSPSVTIRTVNLFDAETLTRIMDKLDRGESLRDD